MQTSVEVELVKPLQVVVVLVPSKMKCLVLGLNGLLLKNRIT